MVAICSMHFALFGTSPMSLILKFTFAISHVKKPFENSEPLATHSGVIDLMLI